MTDMETEKIYLEKIATLDQQERLAAKSLKFAGSSDERWKIHKEISQIRCERADLRDRRFLKTECPAKKARNAAKKLAVYCSEHECPDCFFLTDGQECSVGNPSEWRFENV